jgi:ribosomal protein S27E
MCGARVPLPSVEEITHCPNCGAAIERQFGLKGALLGAVELVGQTTDPDPQDEPGEVTLTESEAEEKWRRDHSDDGSQETSRETTEDTRLRCKYCGDVIANPRANYCPKCGAALHEG